MFEVHPRLKVHSYRLYNERAPQREKHPRREILADARPVYGVVKIEIDQTEG